MTHSYRSLHDAAITELPTL